VNFIRIRYLTDIDILSAAERQYMFLLNTVLGYSSFAVLFQCFMKQIIFLNWMVLAMHRAYFNVQLMTISAVVKCILQL